MAIQTTLDETCVTAPAWLGIEAEACTALGMQRPWGQTHPPLSHGTWHWAQPLKSADALGEPRELPARQSSLPPGPKATSSDQPQAELLWPWSSVTSYFLTYKTCAPPSPPPCVTGQLGQWLTTQPPCRLHVPPPDRHPTHSIFGASAPDPVCLINALPVSR